MLIALAVGELDGGGMASSFFGAVGGVLAVFGTGLGSEPHPIAATLKSRAAPPMYGAWDRVGRMGNSSLVFLGQPAARSLNTLEKNRTEYVEVRAADTLG